MGRKPDRIGIVSVDLPCVSCICAATGQRLAAGTRADIRHLHARPRPCQAARQSGCLRLAPRTSRARGPVPPPVSGFAHRLRAAEAARQPAKTASPAHRSVRGPSAPSHAVALQAVNAQIGPRPLRQRLPFGGRVLAESGRRTPPAAIPDNRPCIQAGAAETSAIRKPAFLLGRQQPRAETAHRQHSVSIPRPGHAPAMAQGRKCGRARRVAVHEIREECLRRRLSQTRLPIQARSPPIRRSGASGPNRQAPPMPPAHARRFRQEPRWPLGASHLPACQWTLRLFRVPSPRQPSLGQAGILPTCLHALADADRERRAEVRDLGVSTARATLQNPLRDPKDIVVPGNPRNPR